MEAQSSGIQMDTLSPASANLDNSTHMRHRDGSSRRRRPMSRLLVHPRSQLGQMEGDKVATLDVYTRANSKVKKEKIDQLRDQLKGFYSTPCEKWNSKPRKFPFKLVLQLLKVLVVTIQLGSFGEERSSFERFSQRNKISFHHVFLKDWGPDREVLPYPPGAGAYAVYSQAGLYDHINYVVSQYYSFDKVTLTPFKSKLDETVHLYSNYYEQAKIHPHNETYDVNTTLVLYHDNVSLNRSEWNDNCTEAEPEDCYNVEKFLSDLDRPIDLDRLVNLKLILTIVGINLKQPGKSSLSQPVADVDCVKFKVTIFYDNSGGNGQIRIKLMSALDMKRCDKAEPQKLDPTIHSDNEAARIGLTFFDGFVLVICIASSILAVRSTFRRLKRVKKARYYFQEYYGYTLTIPEMSDFLTFWYIQYVISDAFVITGTVIKISLRFGVTYDEVTYDNDVVYNTASVMLGIASLFQWIGLIRFLGFFNRYYILILTVSNAVPALVRFLVCGVTIFMGFVFSGWVMFGPYNSKFETIFLTGQTLFSLVNGDEIFATMSIIDQEEQPVIFWFSLIYLYVYITLFIFAIANLFIAVIMDSYESVKNGECFKKSFLHHFIDGTLVDKGTTADEDQRVYIRQTEEEVDAQYGMLSPFLCCLDRCVHHNVNVAEEEDDLGLNDVDLRIHTD